MKEEPLRIAVLGVGLMGEDHVKRIASRIKGAEVSVVNDFFEERAHEVSSRVPGSRVVKDPFEAIAAPDVDAVVITTPGPAHKEQILACLGRGIPVFCEKPLTPSATQSLEVVRREHELGKDLLQIGFMRRFDPEFAEASALIEAGEYGRPLMIHSTVLVDSVPESFTSEMIFNDSLVHDADIARFLFQEEIATVTVHQPPKSSRAREDLNDPFFVIFTMTNGGLYTVQIYVSSGLGYSVGTQVVCENGTFNFGMEIGLVSRNTDRRWGGRINNDFRDRFGAAYDAEITRWVAAARRGTIDGPGAWDGYAANAVSDAALEAFRTGVPAAVRLASHPEKAVTVG